MEDDAALRALLVWFDRAKRDMPWRRDPAPYAVYVSEIMLQQTRVETVIPYFERFLADFPDVVALAQAPLDAVLLRWSGLGYYRRARMLHAAAKEIVARYGGALPSNRAELLSLPGIGRYTAGAVASIGFGERVGLVDGNVARVLARWRGIDVPIDATTTMRALERLTDELVPADRPGDFNQALMELGATVCVPNGAPRCEGCPLAASCVARRDGRTAELPVVRKKAAAKRVELIAAVVREGGRVLLAQREEEGLFGGLFEPPSFAGGRVAASAALAKMGVAVASRPCATAEHLLSHRALVVRIHRGALVGPPHPVPPYLRVELVEPAQLDRLPLAALARKILKAEREAPPEQGGRDAGPKRRPRRAASTTAGGTATVKAPGSRQKPLPKRGGSR